MTTVFVEVQLQQRAVPGVLRGGVAIPVKPAAVGDFGACSRVQSPESRAVAETPRCDSERGAKERTTSMYVD